MDKLDLALLDPAAMFGTPEAILTDEEFETADKIRILKRWAYDIREMQVAQEENMAATQECRIDLGQVLNILHQLDPDFHPGDSSDTKHG